MMLTQAILMLNVIRRSHEAGDVLLATSMLKLSNVQVLVVHVLAVLCNPRVCKRWFPNDGSSLVRRANSLTPF